MNEATLSVSDSGASLVPRPCIRRLVIGRGPNVRILHNHARASIPTQNRAVVSRLGKLDRPFVMAHRFAQRMIRSRSSGSAASNAGVPQALPDNAGVIRSFVIALNSRENFLRGLGVHARL